LTQQLILEVPIRDLKDYGRVNLLKNRIEKTSTEVYYVTFNWIKDPILSGLQLSQVPQKRNKKIS
jgi:hypothetical protein